MAGVSVKKVTFKQRIRRNGLRQRHKVATELRKRARLGRRVSNRFDRVAVAARPMHELVAAIAEGAAIPSQELTLNPRELTDLLLRQQPQQQQQQQQTSNNNNNNKNTKSTTASATTSTPVLPLQALIGCEAVALPDPARVEAEERAREAAAARAHGRGATATDDADAQRAKNQYRHHGQPYVFWQRVGIHALLLQALRALQFSHPTPVQEQVLPELLLDDDDAATTTSAARPHDDDNGDNGGDERNDDNDVSAAATVRTGRRKKAKKMTKQQQQRQCDVVVSAETGSGKTLVFALPILHDILTRQEQQQQQQQQQQEQLSSPVSDDAPPSRQRARAASAHTSRRKTARRDSAATAASNNNDDDENDDTTAAAATTVTAQTATATPPSRVPDRVMHSLVLTPTRELAMQIHDAMRQLTRFCDGRVVVGCLVGGMAAEKQQRVLNRHPHVLIATPGRLAERVQHNEGCYLGHSISRRLHFVVLDEADKMLQSGRFDELRTLLERVHASTLPSGFAQARAATLHARDKANNNDDGDDDDDDDGVLEAGQWDEATQTFIPATAKATRKKNKRKHNNDDDDDDDDDDDEASDVHARQTTSRRVLRAKDEPRPMAMPPPPPAGHRVCTVVTSATLTLQTNYERRDFKGNKSIIRTSNADVLTHVMQELHIKRGSARVFALSPEAGVVAQINETHLRCAENSKDLYLYYFLKTYGDARTIVFVNAISMLRRLVKLLGVLGIAVAGLHAAMQQRQRLKYIDKFRKGVVRVLVATDVASRGLDVDGVRYVLHYQVPRTTDAYIHRCGRTARCGAAGLSLLLVGAAEHVSFCKLMESLGRTGGGGGGKSPVLETFALQPTVVHQLHTHLRLARQIDTLQKEIDKSNAQNRWVTHASRQADLDVDDMYDDEVDSRNREKAKAIRVLRKELDLLTSKYTGAYGGKGGFRTSAQALGAMQAERKLTERAGRQTLLVTPKKTKKKPQLMSRS